MEYILRFFFSSKRSLFHNSNVFGSCIIHILYTRCAKILKKIWRQKVNIPQFYVLSTQCICLFCKDLRTNQLFLHTTLTDWFLYQSFKTLQPSGSYVYHQFNIQQFYVLPTQCIHVFCVDLRTNSDYFPTRH